VQSVYPDQSIFRLTNIIWSIPHHSQNTFYWRKRITEIHPPLFEIYCLQSKFWQKIWLLVWRTEGYPACQNSYTSN